MQQTIQLAGKKSVLCIPTYTNVYLKDNKMQDKINYYLKEKYVFFYTLVGSTFVTNQLYSITIKLAPPCQFAHRTLEGIKD